MCLLIVLHQSHPDADLIVAANRDEVLARPAEPMVVLENGPPRILGGRDLVANGTWLAVNAQRVTAGLTNRPSSQVARDPTKRSRGELPLMLASYPTAEEAVRAFQRSVRPSDYNPAWLLVGDGRSLFYLDLTGAQVAARELPRGEYVLENDPLDADSPKQRMVQQALTGIASVRGDDLLTRLQGILASHQLPEQSASQPEAARRRLRAACVHSNNFGTRSSLIAVVRSSELPQIWFTDGPPCRTAFREATELWEAGSGDA